MATAEPRIPVIVITGFLGSGKTSLLNRLLRDAAFRNSAVVVNEFGEIGIDHLLIGSARDNVLLLDSGCLCCVMADSLRETLANLYSQRSQGGVPTFNRVLIETSGLADPGPIVQALLKDPLVAPLYEFAGIVCAVDALHVHSQLRDHVEAREQVALADRLIVTKLDLCADGTAASVHAQLRELNPLAEIFDSPAAGESIASLFDFRSARRGEPGHEVHARHSSGIGSCSFHFAEPVTWAGIAAWTGHLAERFGDDLLRCKALLRLERRPGCVLVQGVRRSFEIRHDSELQVSDAQSRVVLIGRRLDRETLRSGLAWLHAPDGIQQAATRDFPHWRNAAPLPNEKFR